MKVKNDIYILLDGLNPNLSEFSWAVIMQKIQFFEEFPCYAKIIANKSEPLVRLPNGRVQPLTRFQPSIDKNLHQFTSNYTNLH